MTASPESGFCGRIFCSIRQAGKYVFMYFAEILSRRTISGFDEQVKYAEDIPFTFQYMLYVSRWVKMPDILYNYTLRDSSLSDRYGHRMYWKASCM